MEQGGNLAVFCPIQLPKFSSDGLVHEPGGIQPRDISTGPKLYFEVRGVFGAGVVLLGVIYDFFVVDMCSVQFSYCMILGAILVKIKPEHVEAIVTRSLHPEFGYCSVALRGIRIRHTLLFRA